MTSREKTILNLALLILGVYIFYQFIFVPTKRRSLVLEKRMEAEWTRLQADRAIIRQGHMTEDTELVLQDFTQQGTDEQVMSRMLSDIDKAAETLPVRITERKPRQTREEEFYNEFAVDLSLEGELEHIVRFINQLQSPPYLFDVKEVSLKRRSPRTEDIQCKVVLKRDYLAKR